MGLDADQLGPWIERQRDRGATELRLRAGKASASLKVQGSIDLLAAGQVRDTGEVLTELSSDLATCGYPEELPTFAVDALQSDGKVLKTAQHTHESAKPAAGRKADTPAGSIPESDVSKLMAANVELVKLALAAQVEMNLALIGQLGQETAARRQAEVDALDAQAMANEAQLAAEAERLAALVEGGGEEDSALKSRGVDMLERLVGKMDGAGKMDAAKLKKWAAANPAELRKLATDPDVLDMIMKAGNDAEPPSPAEP